MIGITNQNAAQVGRRGEKMSVLRQLLRDYKTEVLDGNALLESAALLAIEAEFKRIQDKASDMENALSSMYEFFQPHAWGSAYNRADALEDARRALGL